MRLFTPLAMAAMLFASPAVLAQSAKTAPAAPAASSSALAPPANDNFAAATAISGDGESLSSTIDATSEAGEPVVPSSCATDDSNQSVWFTFTAGATGTATFDTNGSMVASPGTPGQFTDTIMSLYTGSAITALTQVACNDDDPENPTGGGDFTSYLEATITAGTRYYVRVSSYAGGVRLNGEVRLSYTGLGTSAATEGGAQAGSRLVVMPNPAVSQSRVSIDAARTQDVRVALYDMLGREVRVLYTGVVVAGQEALLAFPTAGLPAGAYVVRATGAEGLALAQRVTVAH